MSRRILQGLLPLVGMLALSTEAKAQEIQVTGPLAGAPPVKKLRQHRKQRFELAPAISFTLLDEYQRTILVGARLNYNVTDWLGLGVWGAYGAVKLTTGLTDKIQSTNDTRFDTKNPNYRKVTEEAGRRLTALNVGKDFKAQLGAINWVLAPQITLVPFRGKLAIFEKLFVDTDAYFFGGPAFIGLTERAPCGIGTTIDCSAREDLGNQLGAGAAKTKPTENRVAISGTFGLGLTFYAGKWTSFGVEWRAIPFAWNTGGYDIQGKGDGDRFPDNKVDDKDREFKFNQMISLSFSMYFPRELKSSELFRERREVRLVEPRMTKIRAGLLCFVALLGLVPPVWGQGRPTTSPPTPSPRGERGPAEGAVPQGRTEAAAPPETASHGQPAAQGSRPPGAASTPEESQEPGGDSICELDPSMCPSLDVGAMAKRPIPVQMYAVQQKYALRRGRFEVNPYWGFTLNDQYVSHPGPGMALNYYVTDGFAVGINGSLYNADFIDKSLNFNRDSAFNAQTRRSARIAAPLTEYQWLASFNLTYVPVYGKFAGFNTFIFHYDFYLVGGLGAISSRPISVIDPDNRNFTPRLYATPSVGLGLRIFFNRWLSAVLEVRDYVFFDRIESTSTPTDPAEQKKEENWYLPQTTTTNHIQAQLGVSIFLPFGFSYQLPR